MDGGHMWAVIRAAMARHRTSVSRRLSAVHQLVDAEISARSAYAIAVALGVIMCIAALGVDYVVGSSAYWDYPVGDAGTQLAAYREFVADAWHFPLLHTEVIQGPHGLNVLAADIVPIVALLGKLLRSTLGIEFNPYGWWMLGCYALLAVFAVRLARALGQRTLIAAGLAAVFALTFHPFLARFYHMALNGQFLILWALCIYFELPRSASASLFWRRWWLVLAIAMLVHIYLFAMVGTILVASCARTTRDAAWKRLV